MESFIKRIPNILPAQPVAKPAFVRLSDTKIDARSAKRIMSNPDNQSYLAKLSPWAARSSTPVSNINNINNNNSTTNNNSNNKATTQPLEAEPSSGDIGLKRTQGSDHKVTHRHRLSSRSYPKDCPPLVPQWFFATDVPKRRPSPLEQPGKEPEKPRVAPKKYAPFSKTDSKSIEAAFRKIAEDEDAAEQKESDRDVDAAAANSAHPLLEAKENKPNSSFEADEDHLKSGSLKVPVNEDYLFDVDVERRELAPAYWLGPVYEVRRGTWFYQGKYGTNAYTNPYSLPVPCSPSRVW